MKTPAARAAPPLAAESAALSAASPAAAAARTWPLICASSTPTPAASWPPPALKARPRILTLAAPWPATPADTLWAAPCPAGKTPRAKKRCARSLALRLKKSRAARPSSTTVMAATSRADRSPAPRRSEEHTSELQSRGHLVCRLLLEKKKKRQNKKYDRKNIKQEDT